jgi:Right handed beta helix region
VYVSGSTNVTLTRMRVVGNGTYGVQVRGTALRISDSLVSGNGMAGISELQSARGNVYEGNTITANGRDRRPFNGDGIQLNGAGAVVRGNVVSGNGDPGIFEHGVYAGPSSSGYVIESNVLTDNAASDVKAAGAGGVVRFNRLGDSRLGLVFSENSQLVSAYDNLIVGRFQHAVMFTTGAVSARARLWANTIVQTGRPSSHDDASTVFVNAAALADIRNNMICSAARAGGSVLFLKDASRATLVAGANWVCGGDPRGRRFAFGGTRMTLGGWRVATGQDRDSLSSAPADFDADFRVVSANLGARLGQPLGLDRDYAGVALATPTPDIGAYQSSR